MRKPSHPYSHTVVMFSRLYNTENKSVSSICFYIYSNSLFYAIVYILVSNYKMNIQSLILLILLTIFVPYLLFQHSFLFHISSQIFH